MSPSPYHHADSRAARLLCLAPQEPWPATDGGKEGIHGAVQALAARADLLLACPGRPADTATSAHFQSLGVDYRPVACEPRESVAVVLRASLQLKPFKFHKYGTPEAGRRYDEAIGTFEPDAIVCFHAHMEELAQRLKRRRGWDVPVLVREHNIEYEMVASFRATLPSWKSMLAWPIEWVTRRAERQIWDRADVTAFLSDRDFATARTSGSTGRLVLAPEGVPIPPARAAARPAGDPQLLVPLNRRAPQSVANLRSFLHNHWKTQAGRPQLAAVSLAVTGVDPAQLADLIQMPVDDQRRLRIKALGFLPTLQPAFETATAVIAPTFIGGGIRKKILEGMAYQVPVIATDLDIGTCGYFRDGENILRLGSPEEFTTTVHRLLTDDALWHRLSANGRATVELHADWGRFADVLMHELAGAMVGRRRVAAIGVGQRGLP